MTWSDKERWGRNVAELTGDGEDMILPTFRLAGTAPYFLPKSTISREQSQMQITTDVSPALRLIWFGFI